jgi:hypothetical protein
MVPTQGAGAVVPVSDGCEHSDTKPPIFAAVLAVADSPALSVMVSVTVYAPGAAKVCVG